MGFFDNLGKKASAAYDVTAEKTGKLAKEAKFRMKINENARYSILTKGFKDTIKIIESIGGNSQTAHEYCGFGDLIMTSTSAESRNHTLGILYGQRLVIDEVASGIVFEGKNSIKAVKDICNKNNINSDIVDFVYEVIIEKNRDKKTKRVLKICEG